MKKKHLLLAIIMLAVMLGVAVLIIRNNFMLGLRCQKTLLNNVFLDLYLENLTRVVFDVI